VGGVEGVSVIGVGVDVQKPVVNASNIGTLHHTNTHTTRIDIHTRAKLTSNFYFQKFPRQRVLECLVFMVQFSSESSGARQQGANAETAARHLTKLLP